MTYPALIAAIYADYNHLLVAWDAEMEKSEDAGAFVFLPEDYGSAGVLIDANFAYWPTPRLKQYLKDGGQSDEGLVDLILDLDIGEEFLVMIVEYDGDAMRHLVHVHKITKVGLN